MKSGGGNMRAWSSAMRRARTWRCATSVVSRWTASRPSRRRRRFRPTKRTAVASSCRSSPIASLPWSIRWRRAKKPKSWRSDAQNPLVSQLPPPEHVAIIMDGNSRWARERLLPRVMGHKAGIEAIRRVAEAADKRGIRVLTLYAFSTENWSRPREEVDALMNLFSETIRREVDELAERGIELRFSGRLQDLSAALQEQMRQANERTRVSGRAILNIAINYGGRQEIIDAIRELAREGAALAQLDEAGLASHLYTRGLPDPDLVIRTAGEMRLSNFLLWQAGYSEFYSTQTLWPDFGGADFDEALASYQRRVRRFGARPAEVSNRGRCCEGRPAPH